MIAAVLALGIVAGDGVSLRAAPSENAPLVAPLASGDALELRGAQKGYLQVYDHRRERAGYVREAAVRELGGRPEDAPELLAVMSERLGRRASRKSDKPDDPKLALQLDAAQAYGVHFNSVEREGRMELCYDGEAFRRALALSPTPEQAARAALGLTRPECIDPELGPVPRAELDRWRAEVLAKADTARLAPWLAARVHVRRAAVLSALAFAEARAGHDEAAQRAGASSLQELALADPAQLADDDHSAYADAAVRVGASRWAAEEERVRSGPLLLKLRDGEAGERCLDVSSSKDPERTLVERCTHGVVWTASARASPRGNALAVAVQPTDSWRELWVFHQTAQGWQADVLAPAAVDPVVGYIELAGFTPDGKQLLTAREARTPGHREKQFEVLELESLAVQKHADHPEAITAFARWQSAEWRASTVALR